MNSTTPVNHMRDCERCRIRYDWRKSTSSNLKMTFCGSLCEKGALGFTLDSLLSATLVKAPKSTEFRPVFPSWPIAA
jgi:PHP family Zn ribbon phosphoesterase